MRSRSLFPGIGSGEFLHFVCFYASSSSSLFAPDGREPEAVLFEPPVFEPEPDPDLDVDDGDPLRPGAF